ncbi:hypothetical protein SCA6_000930 [Theobroma cacao]|uniref:QLTG3-1 protein n=1 Tax=Theobroma cacao TaxID=3641 RepID=A0A061FY19_THECC|nr:QLTG3-1 protein [Theobroma cacao]
MASKVTASTALFLSFNLLFLAFSVSSHNVDDPSNNDATINPHDSSSGVGEILDGLLNGDSSNGKGLINFDDLSNGSGDNSNNNSKDSATNSENPVVNLAAAAMVLGALNQQGKSTCKPLNLGVCANLLNGLVKVELGDVPTKPCCSLIQGLADLEAAVCLCTAIKANVLGIIKLDLPISLSVLLNNCGREVASDYQCTP